MELRYLQAFTLLAEELHFGRAAKRLGVVQPAFSRTIKALEDEVGVPLVRRSSKAVALTPAGEAFLVPAHAALKRTDDAVRAARLRSASVTGELRLGMMIGAAQPAVGRLIAWRGGGSDEARGGPRLRPGVDAAVARSREVGGLYRLMAR